MYKIFGLTVIAAVALFVIGWALAPFVAVAWFVATYSITDIIKALIIGYIILIPISVFARY